MRERYVEDPANHDDPESCVGGRKAVGEALTGAQAGRVSSLEKFSVRGADAVKSCGRQHGPARHGERRSGPAWSKTPRTPGSHLHGNREILWSSVGRVPADRVGKATAGSR
jgi:hypothetical protein